MNLLLFEQRELHGNRLLLDGRDRRALHIHDVLRLEPGDTLRVGMVNGNMGSGRLLRIGRGEVEMEITLSQLPADDRDITLILALPRPIMLQRILKQATVMGVRTFHLIRSEKVQKSYFQSAVLEKENMRELLLHGLEQAIDTRLPQVFIHHRFRPFVEDVVPKMKERSRLLAHPDAALTLPDIFREDRQLHDLVLAVGPEGGWNDFEIRSFRKQEFACFSFGSRILHVDTAVLVLLSQLMLLQDLSCI